MQQMLRAAPAPTYVCMYTDLRNDSRDLRTSTARPSGTVKAGEIGRFHDLHISMQATVAL